MKNILIATDFSSNAQHACKIGVEIAHKMNAKIHLLHVFALPIVNPELPEFYDFKGYYDIKFSLLEKAIHRLPIGDLEFKIHCEAGISFPDQAMEICEKENIDLFVIGHTGSSALEELFIGSNTTQILLNKKIPILSIPLSFQWKEKMKLAFAYDNKPLNNAKSIQSLRTFASKYSDKIFAFHVANYNNSEEVYTHLKQFIPFNEFELTTQVDENVNDGILEYVSNQSMDILCIIPRKHSFIDRLFHVSYTKEFSRYSAIPILTLPE
ncbi:MAG: universal stress protein [Flavobacteriia bacterium]|nr:universal stress protein [Flavobacteriia bacterium]